MIFLFYILGRGRSWNWGEKYVKKKNKSLQTFVSKTISCQKMGKAREKWFNNQYVLCTATSMFYVLQTVYFMYYNQYVVCTAISMWYVLQSDCFMYCKQFVLCTAISMFYVLQPVYFMYCNKYVLCTAISMFNVLHMYGYD